MTTALFTSIITSSMYAIFSYRRRKEQIETRLRDIQRYAASVGDGFISPKEYMELSPSILAKYARPFLSNSINVANNNAQQKIGLYMSGITGGEMGDVTLKAGTAGNLTPELQTSLYEYAFKSEMERMARIEGKKLDSEERELMMQSKKIDAQLQMEEQRKKSAEEGLKKAIQESQIKFA